MTRIISAEGSAPVERIASIPLQELRMFTLANGDVIYGWYPGEDDL